MSAAPTPRLTELTQVAWLLLAGLILMSPAVAVAGPAEEANAVVDRFSAAYTSNLLITKSGGEWRIAHHHSSPHVQEKK